MIIIRLALIHSNLYGQDLVSSHFNIPGDGFY